MKWTYDEVLEISKQYTTKAEFKKDEPKAYRAANEKHWMKDFTWLKPSKHYIWTKDEIFEESKKYTSRLEFAKKSTGAYTKALKNKWLDDMTWLIPKDNKINIQP